MDDPKTRLVDAAVELLETGGPEAVQVRKVAAAIGASTMSVYTRFGGMPDLLDAMVTSGFVRFAEHVRSVEETDDSLYDFFLRGAAFRAWALANPQLYRLMFGLTGPTQRSRLIQDVTVTGTISSVPERRAAFDVMVASLQRVKDDGRLGDVDTVAAAGQILSATHGFVLLEMSGYFSADGGGVVTVFVPLALNALIGLGASPDDVHATAVAAFRSLSL